MFKRNNKSKNRKINGREHQEGILKGCMDDYDSIDWDRLFMRVMAAVKEIEAADRNHFANQNGKKRIDIEKY